METWEWIAIGAAAGAFVLLAAVLVQIRRRRSHLQERFGTEYHRAVAENGRGSAEKKLTDVERSHDELEIRALPSASRERYREEWRQAEARFVSDPREAVRTAERVVERVLEDRGYALDGDIEQRVALVAVDHPTVAERYRHGHAMIDHVDGAESTENLRKAMVDLRAVFEELLEAERATV